MEHLGSTNEPSHKGPGVQSRSLRLGEIYRFLAAGVLNTLLTYVVYLGALPFFSYPVAYAISLVAGVVFTSLVNVGVVFERRLGAASLAAYASYYVAYYLLNLLGLSLVMDYLGISADLAPLLVLPFTIPLHYLLSRVLLARFQGW